MPRITLFIPYFGNFPNYFQLYLNSLGVNSDVLTVVLLTDIDLASYTLPPNLRVVTTSLGELRLKIQTFLKTTFGHDTSIDSIVPTPYKLVDFKILYPLLFADICPESADDFVGWGDIDVIYGKLAQFVTNKPYDIIGGWHGHFTAIKNTPAFKNMALTVPKLYELCTDPSKTYITDEIAYREPLIAFIKANGLSMCYLNASFCDIVPPCFFSLFRKDYKDYSKNFFGVLKHHTNITYLTYDTDGRLTTLYDDGEVQETSYCHLQKRQMSVPAVLPSRYFITDTAFVVDEPQPGNTKIRLHIPAIPYTITRDEYSHDAFTGKVKRFSPMMRSIKDKDTNESIFEVYHYGVETSESGADHDIQLMTKAEWHSLRIDSMQHLDKTLSREAAEAKVLDPANIVGILANWSTPLFKEFNRRFRIHLSQNYRSRQKDIVCVPLGRSYDDALHGLNLTVIESGIGYSNSCKNYRIFESYSWLSKTLGEEKIWPNNYWFVVPNYYDVSEFQLTVHPVLEPRPRVGFLGRVVKEKGCNIISEVAKRFPNVDFFLCGQGDPTPFLTSPNLYYKAPIHGSERSEYLGSCVAVMCPTLYLEPFGGSNVESQLCGTPVISVDNGAFVETVEQFRTGLRCHTLADFCKGVQMALDGAFDRAYIRERAVRLYDMYTLAKNYEYVFRSVLDIHIPAKNGWYSPDCHLRIE